jgi:hypothetical protein
MRTVAVDQEDLNATSSKHTFIDQLNAAAKDPSIIIRYLCRLEQLMVAVTPLISNNYHATV